MVSDCITYCIVVAIFSGFTYYYCIVVANAIAHALYRSLHYSSMVTLLSRALLCIQYWKYTEGILSIVTLFHHLSSIGFFQFIIVGSN